MLFSKYLLNINTYNFIFNVKKKNIAFFLYSKCFFILQYHISYTHNVHYEQSVNIISWEQTLLEYINLLPFMFPYSIVLLTRLTRLTS